MNIDQALPADRGPSRSSLLGLDALNFLMADVRDGVGPYLSVYLKGGLHWQSGEIGIAMAVSSITAAICQIPAGLLVTGVGAAASNVFAGFVVQIFGYTTGFLVLAAIAAGGLFFFASFMPETKPEEEIGTSSPQGDTPAPKPV